MQPDPRWREIHCGRFENATWDEYNADVELQRLLEEDPYNTVLPGGESLAMLTERVAEAFEALTAHDGPSLVVVTHDGPIRALLSHCLHIPPTRFWNISTEHGGVSCIRVKPEWVSVCTVNDVSHLHAAEVLVTGNAWP